MRIAELMSRDLRMVSPETTIQEASRMMLDADVGVLPVGTSDSLQGVVTDRDLVVRALAMGRGPETPVREAMSGGQMVVCYEDQDVYDAAIIMSDAHVRRVPVLSREGKLIGMLSLGDLARHEDTSPAETAIAGVAQASSQHDQSAEGAAGQAM